VVMLIVKFRGKTELAIPSFIGTPNIAS